MEVRWRRRLLVRGGEVFVAGATLVVAERHTHLVALDRATGDVRWDVGGISGNAVLAGGSGAVVARDERGRTTCVDARNGAPRWHLDGPGHVRDFIAVIDDVLLCGGWRGYQPQHARSLETGDLLWSSNTTSERRRPVPFARGALTADPSSATAWVLDPRSGQVTSRWHLPAPVAAADLTPVPFRIDHDEALLHTLDDRVVLATTDSEVRELCHHSRPLTAGVVSARAGERLWVPTRGGSLTVVDLASGRSIAEITTAEQVVGLATFDGGIVTADRSGAVTLTDLDGARLGRFTVPRPIDAVTTSPGLLHVLGKGHLTTFTLATPDRPARHGRA